MCSSYDFIERQAQEMSEMIRKYSLYKVVRCEYKGGINKDLLKDNAIQVIPGYIEKVILEDKDGTLYSVEPSPIGLSFAKREISYKEYLKRTKSDTLHVVSGFTLIIVVFGLCAWLMVRFMV
jgi:hypothetical protein